jgi:type I restriction enzyme S subunit
LGGVMDMVAKNEEQENDGPWELPEGWGWTTVSELPMGGNGSVEPSKTPNESFVLYSVPAFEAGKPEYVRGEQVESNKQIVPPDALLVCKINPRINRIWRVDAQQFGDGKIIASTEWIVIRQHSIIEPDYLRHFLSTERVRQYLAANVSGVGGSLMRVNAATVGAIPLPLAPLAEQRRIVTRVDALFAGIAEGQAALAAARKGLDTFRRALLKAAVTGELTKDCREKSPVTETGHDLLARIRSERAAKGQAKGRGKRAAELVEGRASPLDTSALPRLSEGWVWGTIEEILLGIEAGLNVSAEGRPPAGGETGIVKVSAVTWGEFDENASKALPSSAAIDTRDLIEVGDFLFSRANTLELVGAPVIVKSINKRLVLSDKILRFRLVPGTEPWLEVVLKSAFGRQQIESRATGAQLSMRNISQDSIRAIPVPIPPPEEAPENQRRVSEARAARADTLAMLDAEAADAARLKQSILKAAFEGRLAPQDPADEPASAMLARLKATQSTAGSAKRGRARKSAP